MYTLREVVSLLKQVAEFDDAPNIDMQPVSGFYGGLRDKIESRVKKWKEKCLKTFKINLNLNYVGSYEIGNLTGNQALRVLIKVLRDKKLCEVGNCVLFAIETEICVAFIFPKPGVTEAITLPPPAGDLHYKFIFSKLFDDDSVELQRNNNANYSHYYSKNKIFQLRHETKSLFPNFLKVQLKEFPALPYRCAYLSAIFEIAKTSFLLKYYTEQNINCEVAPAAACIKLALDFQETGKLNRVFGEKLSDDPYPGRNTLTHSKQNLGQTLPERACKKEVYEALLQFKASLRMQATKEIIHKAIPSTKEGLFREEVVKKILDEIKDLYQIDPSRQKNLN